MENRTKHVLQIASLLVVLVALLVLFEVINSPLDFFKKKGTFLITGIDENFKVYADGKKKTPTFSPHGLLSLLTGTHTILISREGYWPWLKTVELEEKEIAELNPFFFKENPETEIILGDNPEYDALVALIKNNLPSKTPNDLISHDGTVTVWQSGEKLEARWLSDSTLPASFCIESCENEISFFKINLPIRNLAFFPNRNDVVLISTGNAIYALELDRKPVQNFQQVYSGIEPAFTVTQNGSLYLFDQNTLYLLHTP